MIELEEFIKQKILKIEKEIENSKPDDLMFIEWCEDRIKAYKDLLEEYKGQE